MLNKLHNDLLRRKEGMYQFYYQGIGISIKKKRLELNLTQESLAKGICSNTYISKIENNAIVVNKENLYLIMERMKLPLDAIGFPEEMIDILEKSLYYFVRKDVKGYQDLFNSIAKYEYGILIFIARLGYHVLIGDFISAKPLYKEMYRYLSSLEEYGIMVFVIYACWYNITISDYECAKNLYFMAEKIAFFNEDTKSMYALLQYVIFGNIQLFTIARNGFDLAKNHFMETNNLARIAELMVYKNIFHLFNNNQERVDFEKDQLKYLTSYQNNYYLMLLSVDDKKPEIYWDLFDKDERYYIDYLYLLGASFREKNLQNEYEAVKSEISALHYRIKSPIDFLQYLALGESKNNLAYKEYLINVVWPYHASLQSLFLMRKTTDEIVSILRSKKRYKDALAFEDKYQKTVLKFQTIKEVKWD